MKPKAKKAPNQDVKETEQEAAPIPGAEPEPQEAAAEMTSEEAAAEGFEEGENTMQGLLQEAEAQSQKLAERQVTTVRVIQCSADKVFVDVGEKLEGVIPASEFPGGVLPEPGSEIPVVLMRRGGVDRHALLSHKKAREELGWGRLRELFAAKTRVGGTVTKAVKGGFMVDIEGVDAFLPLSLADRRPLRKGENLAGKPVECVILEIDEAKRRVVVSRRQVVEEDFLKKKRQRLSAIRPGQVIEGKVSSVTESGAFVDLGGAEGLVALSELSWKPVTHGKDVLKVGQKAKVKVLGVDLDALKISLGIKQLQENPADALRRRYKPGAKVSGKVLKSDIKGVLVQVGPDIMGFVPVTDFLPREERERGEPRQFQPREQVKEAPKDMPKEGETVSAVVSGVNSRTFELNLSIRRFQEIEDRARVQQYLKGAPRLTLGDLFKSAGE